jgi:predicted transcriptional regulator
MKEMYGKKPMMLGDTTMYLENLVKMGFVSKHVSGEKTSYMLTELGEKSGLEDLPNTN